MGGDGRPGRGPALLLAGGVVVFGAAAVAGDPYERKTPESLYAAIASDVPRYQRLNALATAGVAAVLAGFLGLASATRRANGAATAVGVAALVMGGLLWLAEASLRANSTARAARAVQQGASPPGAFPEAVGVGQEPLFRASLSALLAGMAALVWALGDAGLVPRRIARLGAAVAVGSGAVAAATYPFIGAVERILFYPLVAVVAPLALWLLARGFRQEPRR